MSYVRNTYQEYKDNDNYNITLDDFIERRWINASNNNKKRFDRNNANVSRKLH